MPDHPQAVAYLAALGFGGVAAATDCSCWRSEATELDYGMDLSDLYQEPVCRRNKKFNSENKN